MAAPDYSGVTADIQKGYDYQRQKAAQQEGANLQGQRDALARRAAQLGGGPSGAFIKTEQQAGNDSAQRLQSANEGIDQAQNQELRGVHMTQLGQQFQTSEREAGQGFQSGERAAAQGFQAGEHAKDISFQTGVALGSVGGQDTLAKKTAADAHDLAVGGLTGTYNGADTLAKKTAADAHDLAVSGQGLQKEALDHTISQDDKEYAQNIKTSVFNGIQSLVASGQFTPTQIQAMIKNIYPDFDIGSLGQGVWGAPPPQYAPTVTQPATATPPGRRI